MPKYKAIDIAHWFIWKNRENEQADGEKMTLLKLLKLLYYSEGSSLALDNGSLFDEPIVAWEHGPVVEEVYCKYPDPYDLESADEDEEILESVRKIGKDDAQVLEEIGRAHV